VKQGSDPHTSGKDEPIQRRKFLLHLVDLPLKTLGMLVDQPMGGMRIAALFPRRGQVRPHVEEFPLDTG
jgi:hypothetical protein